MCIKIVQNLTDACATCVASYTYDAFGNTATATGSAANTNKYRFSTKPIDDAIPTNPLYYYGYRFYNPITGRWINRDPIEEKGGLNLYGFVGNDGINSFDFLGMSIIGDFFGPFLRRIHLAYSVCDGVTGCIGVQSACHTCCGAVSIGLAAAATAVFVAGHAAIHAEAKKLSLIGMGVAIVELYDAFFESLTAIRNADEQCKNKCPKLIS